MADGTKYNHQTVVLDGESFSGSEFVECRLIYNGGEPPELDGCRFDNCEWKFEDAAGRTLTYLKLIWAAGAKPAVQSMIKEITVAQR